jgi:hypothetical protein
VVRVREGKCGKTNKKWEKKSLLKQYFPQYPRKLGKENLRNLTLNLAPGVSTFYLALTQVGIRAHYMKYSIDNLGLIQGDPGLT